ncbi:unnamed protein product [Linum trigynum]|uniref:Uncharacterized protein n=1 Tax=Linum trigynum TaxID=586398 RepID=A0AAV2F4H1_9ROSI
MRQLHQQYEEWVGLSLSPVPMWTAPEPGLSSSVDDSRVICMWDGATRRGSHSAGGMVIMNPERAILMAKGVQFQSIDDP